MSRLRKFAEVLRENQFKYQMVIENLHEGLGIVDENEDMVFVNEALCNMLGYTRKELLDMNISDVVPQDEFRKITSKTDHRRSGKKETYGTVVITKDGSRKEILISAAPWFNEKGEYRGSFGLLLDVTEQKEKERTLSEKEEKYRATVEQSAENIYIYDIERHEIVESNKALQDLLGYSDDELKKMRASDFIEHTPDNIQEKINEVLKKGHTIVGERVYRRKDGTPVDVEVSASRIHQGDRVMLCVVSRDISETKRYQENLIDERNRAEFYLDLLAHDIGNLLHGIKNGLTILDMVRGDVTREKETLKMAKDLADRASRLSNDILTFSRIRDKEPELKPIEVEPLFMRAIKRVKNDFPQVLYKEELELEEGLQVKGEPYLEEVFYHIFHNSFKSQSKYPLIGARTKGKKNEALIEIWDNGGGIPEKLKESLFHRYERVSERKHSGIGLTLVNMIIERHGGEISVGDHFKDGKIEGTRFKITLKM
jgi:PAS domain S-box-containing protein